MRSSDRGASFTLCGNLGADIDLWEPNVVETAPDRLVMLMRAEGVPVKYRADSTDGGRTWSGPRVTDIPCANSKITLLKHGESVLMLHNPSAQTGWLNRTTLSLWISRDGCNTWPVKLDLVESRAADRVICYPHAFIDAVRQRLYVACDAAHTHYLFTVSLKDLECA